MLRPSRARQPGRVWRSCRRCDPHLKWRASDDAQNDGRPTVVARGGFSDDGANRGRIAAVKAEREKLSQIFDQRFPDYVALSKPQPVSLSTGWYHPPSPPLRTKDLGLRTGPGWGIVAARVRFDALMAARKGSASRLRHDRRSAPRDEAVVPEHVAKGFLAQVTSHSIGLEIAPDDPLQLALHIGKAAASLLDGLQTHK